MEIDLYELLRATPELVLFLVLGFGYLIGNLGIGSIQLGAVSGVLIAGLCFGHVGLDASDSRATAVGFVLFIYSVGLQAGPRFFSVMRADGPRYVALVVITAGAAIAALLAVSHAFGLSSALSAGILAGALTSTPALAAAQDAVSSGLAAPGAATTSGEMLEEIAVGYAISYLIGLIGLLGLVQLVPRLMRLDLAGAAASLGRHLRLPEGEDDSDHSGWRPLVRSYEVEEGALTGRPLREVGLPQRTGAMIQQVKRDARLFDPGPDLVLQAGDRLLVMGDLTAQRSISEELGAPVLDPDLLDVPTEAREVVVTSSAAAGQRLRDLDLIHRFGCFVVTVTRAQVGLPVTPDLLLEKGDTLYVHGTRKGLDGLARELGHAETEVYQTDLLTFAFGIAAGLVLGSIQLKLGEVSVGLGSAGGLLLSGIVVGFLRSLHPTFGRVPRAARFVFMEFGLMLFMAGVGLRAGPTFLETAAGVGPALVATAFAALVTPFVVGTLFGLYVLRLNPALLLGAMTGALTSTPALGMVSQLARSGVPALGYAGAYAFACIVFAFVGSALVRF